MKLIPSISDDVLVPLASRIKPVVRHNGPLWYIKPVDLRGFSFLWDIHYTNTVYDLIPLKDITTYHTFGYWAFFKPTIAEVIAQISTALLPRVVAFEILKQHSMRKTMAHFDLGYHVATTRLYYTE